MNLVPRKKSMALWDPWSELDRLQRDMTSLFDSSLANTHMPKLSLGKESQVLAFAVDIEDQKDRVIVQADIPGVDKKDLDIHVADDVLTIKGEKRDEKTTKEKGLVRNERYFGRFQRVIELPAEVDSSKVTASYKNGVLEIVLPKKEGTQLKQTQIEVK